VDGKKRLPASNVAYGFEENIFVWMAKNSWRGERMGAAMKQAHAVANGNVVHGKYFMVSLRTELNIYFRLSMG